MKFSGKKKIKEVRERIGFIYRVLVFKFWKELVFLGVN